VLEGGSAITIDSWADVAPAILMAWYPGMEGGTAIADVLFGDVCPGGRLPISFPHAGDPLPEFDSKARAVRYDMWHGYRLADREGAPPMFPFGFGLSYARFEYSNLSLTPAAGPDESIKASFDIANTGAAPGDETAQVYISYPCSAVVRPVRELKAFKRVPVEPGKTAHMEISIDPKELAYFDVESGDWRIERARYGVRIGSSADPAHLPLAGEFEIR